MTQHLKMIITAALLITVAFNIAAFCVETSRPQNEVLEIGSDLQLFVDDGLIASMNGASLKMHSPERREIVFVFDALWEGVQSGYVSILRDEKIYKMYYCGGGDLTAEHTCLAESRDGIVWNRPDMGMIDFNGSRKNNIVFMGDRKSYAEAHNLTPFIDANPKCPPEHRYKAVALRILPDDKGDERKMLVALSSPDGLHWKRMSDKPILSDGGFDSQNVAFWDSSRQKYLCYYRDRKDGLRSIKTAESDDFLNWRDKGFLDFGEAQTEHFYTNAILPYFRSPRLFLGFPMRFVPERTKVWEEEFQTDGLSDAVMISSRDGIHFKRTFKEAFIRPGLNRDNWGNAHSNITPAWGMIPTSPSEISLYWTEFSGNIPQLRRGVVRTDGFASLHAPYAGAEILTRQFTFKGKRLVINYSTSAVGIIQFEIQDEAGNPATGFALTECKELWGDEIERTVSWKLGSDLSALQGKVIRLRIVMKDADLFSFRFAD